MSAASSARPWWRRPVLIAPLAVAALVVAMLQQTTFVGAGESIGGDEVSSADDATALARDGYTSTVVPAITEQPTPVTEIVTAALEDPEAAGEEHGRHEAEGKPYSYAVTATGKVVEGEFGELGLEVEGLPREVSLGIAVPPYGASSSLRDVGLDVQYGDFENQIAYQGVALELNSLAAEDAYEDLDPEDLLGRTVTVQGATTWTSVHGGDVTHLSVLPVSIEEPS
ncbi:DUF2291 domain-containing protein [Brachybacterium sp. NBEC-018]|uniref:DUF2291 domain-containing protein n=1 Tax=Brachybacterium sp. NBEC-018 TaxID=2996004 RepID=UPI002174FDD0|nr:DUF2291 domain-containing protein [Brachybacterium sp. NBEC-018]UVY84527.1 DUF2291 domain-containing protein [Brachybacterium sp. NBEC-018]